jgi:hypothetical protein
MQRGHMNVKKKKNEVRHYDSSDTFCRAHSSLRKNEEMSFVRNCKTVTLECRVHAQVMLRYGKELSSDIRWITYWCPGECYSMARSYRRTFIETAGDVKYIFSHKVFCGWDFSITTREAVDLKSSSIYNELQVSLQFVPSVLAPLLPPSARIHQCTADVHTLVSEFHHIFC